MGVDTHGPRPPPIVDAGSCAGYAQELDAENPARSKADACQSEGQIPQCSPIVVVNVVGSSRDRRVEHCRSRSDDSSWYTHALRAEIFRVHPRILMSHRPRFCSFSSTIWPRDFTRQNSNCCAREPATTSHSQHSLNPRSRAPNGRQSRSRREGGPTDRLVLAASRADNVNATRRSTARKDTDAPAPPQA